MTDAPPPATESGATHSEPTRSGPPSALSVEEIAGITGGRILSDSNRPVLGAAIDSRAVEPANLFVALPGEHTDGHRFVGDAIRAGAAAALVMHDPDAAVAEAAADAGAGIVLVEETLPALQALATEWRRRFDLLVVGVTGSIAKTSTKEAIAAVLGRRFVTLRNEGNLNNEIGLPLTVLRIRPEHQAAVLEMGMYVGGEIADLARIGQPRFGVVTAVAGVHLSRIGSLDAIERAKGELVEALPAASAGGVAILNADDERVTRMDRRTAAAVVRYGFTDSADVRAEQVTSRGRAGMRFGLVVEATRRWVDLPVPGKHSVHNALAAAAAGHAAGMAIDDVVEGLERGWSAPHRTEVVEAGRVLVIDDTYNASPRSMRAALETLAGMPGRHVAVLGLMLELGDEHDAGHREVGEAAAGLVDRLIVIGDEAAGIAEAAAAAAQASGGAVVTRVPDREHALDLLRAELRPGDAVLMKASRGLGLPESEKTVRGLGLEVLVGELVKALSESDA